MSNRQNSPLNQLHQLFCPPLSRAHTQSLRQNEGAWSVVQNLKQFTMLCHKLKLCHSKLLLKTLSSFTCYSGLTITDGHQ